MATHKYTYTVEKKNTDINIHTNKYKQTHIIRTFLTLHEQINMISYSLYLKLPLFKTTTKLLQKGMLYEPLAYRCHFLTVML